MHARATNGQPRTHARATRQTITHACVWGRVAHSAQQSPPPQRSGVARGPARNSSPAGTKESNRTAAARNANNEPVHQPPPKHKRYQRNSRNSKSQHVRKVLITRSGAMVSLAPPQPCTRCQRIATWLFQNRGGEEGSPRGETSPAATGPECAVSQPHGGGGSPYSTTLLGGAI